MFGLSSTVEPSCLSHLLIVFPFYASPHLATGALLRKYIFVCWLLFLFQATVFVSLFGLFRFPVLQLSHIFRSFVQAEQRWSIGCLADI